jgi:hypothetical protein
MMANQGPSKEQLLDAAHQQSELRNIVQQVVYDYAPRTISLARAEQMADSIAYQISSGTLMSFVVAKPNDHSLN